MAIKKFKTPKETGKYGPYSGKKKQSIETVPKEAQVLDLLDKDVKSAVIKVQRA